jgi:hypothetical protein
MSSVLRLPVADVDVTVRPMTGDDELLVVERAPDFASAVQLCNDLLRRVDGEPLAWAEAVVTDLDAALLWLRRSMLGDTIRTDVRCACGEQVDLAFSIATYVDHHRPRPSPAVASDAGWFRIGASEFRLPRASDQVAISRASSPEASLIARCTRGPMDADARHHIEQAMEALAPSLCDELEGSCPGCGGTFVVTFDPLEFSLTEIRDVASTVHEDVCAIANHCHWTEAAILAMPSARRARYAALARLE